MRYVFAAALLSAAGPLSAQDTPYVTYPMGSSDGFAHGPLR
ncbi:MAG TPA: hypothetical protein VEJ18_10195 [Planctomycetota bacterium]|nr:hypothetical protein [Planctomycetota bacterium]